MNTLPGFEKAVIPIEKLRDYALSPQHRYGKNKARVFKAVLGINSKDADWLSNQILSQLHNFNAALLRVDEYGKRYTVDLKIRNFNNEAWVRTGWIILRGTDYPRLTTCFIVKSEEI